MVLVPDLSLLEIIYLDKVAKKKPLQSFEIKALKTKKLIEGRKPNFYIASNVAKATGEQASYIKQRGFKDDHYRKMILEYIKEYGHISKAEIDDLIIDILPAILDKKKKGNKVRNIIYSMSKRDKSIINKGTNRYPRWELSSSNENIKLDEL